MLEETRGGESKYKITLIEDGETRLEKEANIELPLGDVVSSCVTLLPPSLSPWRSPREQKIHGLRRAVSLHFCRVSSLLFVD